LGLANSSARLLPEGTVVLSRTASVGFVAVMGKPMATSQDFVNWVPGPKLRSWYLAYALIGARDYLRGLSSGAVHKTIYMPTLKRLHIRLPSLDDQDRMVQRIREAHALVDDANQSVGAQSEALDALPASLLSAAFCGEL
jgi:type I restriction enzyme S subunit